MSGAEAVKVIVRCRPMNSREKDLKCKPCVFMDSKLLQCSLTNPNDPNAPPKAFTFDGVYYTDSTTETIYNEIAYPLVEGVLEGYNGTVFAYGQTGCGKSFSMQGIQDPSNQRGIIPRAFEHIFEAIDASENMKYLVRASYLEIYNEEIRDLLGQDTKKRLELKEHPDKGVYVADISLHPVHNTAECEVLMERGWKNRATGATLMNADSSRSHSIFTINIEMMATGGSSGEKQHIRRGKLNLVDLAGSERQAKTQASGDRLKEATKINLSLSALGNVISALVDGKSKHIPYRDSKLTRLLQDSLGGNTKTLMVACLSPADNNYDETLSTLRYANRAKNIKNKPKINEDPKDALLREYQEEIQKLKAMLDQKPSSTSSTGLDELLLEEERQRMRLEFESEMIEMRMKMETEKEFKAKMQSEMELMRKEYEDKMRRLELEQESIQEKNQILNGGDLDVQPEHNLPTAETKDLQASVTAQNFIDSNLIKADKIKDHQDAIMKLKKLQEEMIEGGKRAGDSDLKERRKRKKKAAETRLRALGEALGHVDDEDGVLIKVYDDIQEELRVKTEALKVSRHKARALTAEIHDLQMEFEDDRADYLDTIRKQDQQIKLLQQILDKIQPTIRKDSNYCNIEKVKQESVWNDESQRWKVPELTFQKTRLPPAGANPSANAPSSSSTASAKASGMIQSEDDEATLPEAVTDEDEDGFDNLQQKLAKGEEENVAGTYFKSERASKLVAEAKEVQKGNKSLNTSSGSINLNSNLSSSFNSGLNTVGVNNFHLSGIIGGSGGRHKELPAWFGSRGPFHTAPGHHGIQSVDVIKKPARLEALPQDRNRQRKRTGPGPILNTMGTF